MRVADPVEVRGTYIDPTKPQEFKASTIYTYSGGMFDPLNPDPDLINPIDIAHALSNICRYTGHVDRYYPVATHCVIMHDYGVSIGLPESTTKWLLMHDSDEAYLVDLPAPIKHSINGFGEAFKAAAKKITEAVAIKFELSLPEPPIVKEIDIRLRENEVETLFPRQKDHDRRHYGEKLPVRIHNWTPTEAKYQMLWRMEDHGIVRRDHEGEYIDAGLFG